MTTKILMKLPVSPGPLLSPPPQGGDHGALHTSYIIHALGLTCISLSVPRSHFSFQYVYFLLFLMTMQGMLHNLFPFLQILLLNILVHLVRS